MKQPQVKKVLIIWAYNIINSFVLFRKQTARNEKKRIVLWFNIYPDENSMKTAHNKSVLATVCKDITTDSQNTIALGIVAKYLKQYTWPTLGKPKYVKVL